MLMYLHISEHACAHMHISTETIRMCTHASVCAQVSVCLPGEWLAVRAFALVQELKHIQSHTCMQTYLHRYLHTNLPTYIQSDPCMHAQLLAYMHPYIYICPWRMFFCFLNDMKVCVCAYTYTIRVYIV